MNIASLLKKTEHYDKDERYMATSDLCEVLKRLGDQASNVSPSGSNLHNNSSRISTNSYTPVMDTTTEQQICTAVLRLLHDKSNDVQAIAVKTLGVLLTTVQQEQVIEIANSLADQVLDASKSELRDVYAIGLRTLVKTVPVNMGNLVAQSLVGRLLEGIRGGSTGMLTTNTQEIVLACLDILTDLLGRFGATALSLTRQHDQILQMCLQQLQRQDSPSSATLLDNGGGTGGAHVIRKRAGNTLGCLSVVLSDNLLHKMVESVLLQIDQSSTNGGDVRALIRTMCTVSGSVGHRLGQAQIDRIIPIFLRFTKPDDAVTGDDHDNEVENNGDDDEPMSHDDNPVSADDAALQLANELRESCFMGFESFIMQCPNEVEPHLEKIIQASLAYMNYDPNYSYGSEDDNEENDQGDEGVDAALDEENEYDDEQDEDDDEDDDDDESWKVRRSAIRSLRAIVEAKKHDPAASLWKTAWFVRNNAKKTTVAAAIISRFKEREENCRVGVIECFTRLLAVTIQACHNGHVQLSAVSPVDTMTEDNQTVPIVFLRTEYTPKLVRSCEKILSVNKGNDRSKSCALSLLATLCRAPGGVGGQNEIASVFKHVKTFLLSPEGSSGQNSIAHHREGASKALRLDALQLVHSMLMAYSGDGTYTEPRHIRISLRKTLLPDLCHAVKEQWYKVIAEALRALMEVPFFFTDVAYNSSDDATARAAECREVAAMVYGAIEPLLAAHDVDQEIKEAALKASASLLSSLHKSLTDEETQRLLTLLLDRLRNETTRIAAIKTISSIATLSDGKPGNLLSPIFAESISTMASFLKLSSRSIQQSSLEAMDRVITTTSTGDADTPALYKAVLQELAPVISDKDLHISHLSLRVSVSILATNPASAPAVKEYILGRSLDLSTSPLLQDLALESLLGLFKEIIVSNAIEFRDLLNLLRSRLSTNVSKHGTYGLAKCIAVITAATNEENRQSFFNEVFFLLEGSPTPEDSCDLRQVQLSLLISGDLCRMINLDGMTEATTKLRDIYLQYFESSSEDLKHAASYALGNASVGAPSTFLPAIVSKLNENYKKQHYLLLSALREFIQCSSRTMNSEGVAKILDLIIPSLESHCSIEEEGVRTMVAECLGSLACLQPQTILSKLQLLQSSHQAIKVNSEALVDDEDVESKINARVCWTVATSIKLAVAGKVDSAELSAFMPTFIQLLKVRELHCRNAALLMVYSTLHHMPQVVLSLLKESILPSLFEVADLKLERSVNLGPFTHKIDDAVPLRKASLSIFATCLDHLSGSLDIPSFMPVLAKALNDAEDIQLHAHQILISMCTRQPTYVVAAVDTFVEPLEKTLKKSQGQKSGTELERFNDWMKSALRVVLALTRLDGTMNSRKFAEFVDRVRNDPNSKYRPILQSLEEEQ